MANNEVETTGHQWDDEEGYPLKEYNNPLPKWWLYTFYATIVWAMIYWVLYPAWPTMNGYTKGVLGWSQHKQLQEEMDEATLARKAFDDQLKSASLEKIASDPQLLAYATAAGKAVFGNNCAPCHGSGGSGGAKGFPVLVDDDWIYGGTLATIEETIQYGRSGVMPAHLEAAGGGFSEKQVSDLTEYVLKISGQSNDSKGAENGDKLFHGDAGCLACHGEKGLGSLNGKAYGGEVDDSIGALNLSDALWLYGNKREDVYNSIAKGRKGSMPAWGKGFEGFGRKLDPLAIKQLTLYVHGLGGGQ